MGRFFFVLLHLYFLDCVWVGEENNKSQGGEVWLIKWAPYSFYLCVFIFQTFLAGVDERVE
jgi:hypothetical protein